MTDGPRFPSIIVAVVCTLILAPTFASADDTSLLLIERRTDDDRNTLIEAGITLVAETEDALIAVGPTVNVTEQAARHSRTAQMIEEILDDDTRFALVGLRPGSTELDLQVCGNVIARGSDWRLVREIDFDVPACLESDGWFIHILDMDPLAPIMMPPATEAGVSFVADPLVQEMVDRVDTAVALSHWTALSESVNWTTRHSSSQGCVDAAAYVHDLFTILGLQTTYQHHTGGYADNVIGTLTGTVEPDRVYIAIGHLDDLPSSGPAPGADDNASGTAMVTALAEVMSDYCFARTTKFIAVTGEEQGLNGSDYYADAAAASGEDIQAVLNGDMIGWEGDGQPAVEDLDINYNSGSQWLAQAMVDASNDYNTGLVVNAFSCPSMVYSDHAPFWDNGFSAVCGITDNEGFCGYGGNYPYYHQSSDIIANCGPGAPEFEAAAIRTYLATMAHLAQPIARIPDPPTGVSAQGDGANRIALSWPSLGAGISTRIYRSTGGCADPSPPVLIAETANATYVDTTVSGGVPYAYTLAASAATSCNSQPSICVEATTTGTCNEPPTFVGAEQVINPATSTCRLTVGWSTPDHVWCGGPVSYNLYRSLTPDFTPSGATQLALGLVSTTFDDLDVVSGEDYHYIVRAVDQSHGGEDANTNEASGSPTGPPVIGSWHDDAGDTSSAKLIPTNPWAITPGGGLTGAGYATGTYGTNLCVALTTPELLFDADPQMEFWSKYDIEDDWDKGELQISVNGGSSWQRVPMTYPGTSTNTNDACGFGTGSYFTGDLATYAAYSADLSAWAGQQALLRWVFSSDGAVNGAGWWIDEISISDVAVPGECFGGEALFADGFESGDTSAWSF